MINIIVNDKNSLFVHGLEAIFKTISERRKNAKFSFSNEWTEESVASADVIIKTIASGESYLCQKFLAERDYRCVVIIFYEEGAEHQQIRRTHCLSNTFFLEKSIAPKIFENIIENRWNDITARKRSCIYSDCRKCHHFKLKGMQLKISQLLFNHHNAEDISRLLDISVKTVHSHKYIIMKRLGLKNTYDLWGFLHAYHERFGLKP